MKKSALMILAVCFLLLNITVSAQEQELLKQLQNKFNSVDALSADINQIQGKNNISGKISIKKSNMFKLDLKNATIVSDGSTVWNYNKRDNKVIINEVNSGDPSALSIERIINEYPDKSDISIVNEAGRDVLVLKPGKESGLNFDRIMLWMNNENLPEKIRVEQSGNPVEINITNYNLNREIPDSQFRFTPPQGSQVIDLR
jgi:outer membrane lipoprotein carrier protein